MTRGSLVWLPEHSGFRIVGVDATGRTARQLALLGLFEHTEGRVLARDRDGAFVIEHENRRLRLPARLARCLRVLQKA